MCDHCGCHEYQAIGDLAAEHETILELAWRVAEASPPDPAIVDALLAVFDPHVEKEERGLYPALLAGGDLEPEAAGLLEAEHAEVRTALTSGTFDRRTYFALARHIEEEEMELFPSAMFGFEDDTWDALETLAAQV